MPWPTVTRNEDGTASCVILGQTVQLGILPFIDGDKTSVLLRLFVEIQIELLATVPDLAKRTAMRNLLTQLRSEL